MAWVEQVGQYSWRVRYRSGNGCESMGGFHTLKAAEDYMLDVNADQRRGIWLDPAGARTHLAVWADRWLDVIDVEIRTEENRRCLRLHILPRWGDTPLGEITASAVAEWLKLLRQRYAASTVAVLRTVLSMLLDDAVDDRLMATNPVRRRRRRGRRRDHGPAIAERVWAMPEHVLRVAEQATMLGGNDAGLLVLTAAWTGCRWGELAGLQRALDLARGVITIDPDTGALHESAHRQWLGPPKTPASARTIALPPFLVTKLRDHLSQTDSAFVFTSPRGRPLWRSTFCRRVFRPAVNGDPSKGVYPVRPGLTFHGLRHSHKTWLIADGIPEIAQARRLGHHLANRLTEVYSHVAPEIEARLLRGLQQRWIQATKPAAASWRNALKSRPSTKRHRRDPHTVGTRRTTLTAGRPLLKPHVVAPKRRTPHLRSESCAAPDLLQTGNPTTARHTFDRDLHPNKEVLRPGETPSRRTFLRTWS